MRTDRAVAALLVVLVVMSSVSVIDGPLATAQEPSQASSGEFTSSVLDIQAGRIDGELRRAAFQERLDGTEGAERAEVIAAELNRTEGRLSILEARLETLQSSRDNGSITGDEYAVRVAPVASDARALGQVVERATVAASDINNETLQEVGITQTRLSEIETRINRVVNADEGAVATTGLGTGFYRQVAEAAERYNQQVMINDLGLLGRYVSSERITLRIIGHDGSTNVISFRTTEDGRVRDLRAGAHPNPTLRVTTDETTARTVVNSDQPGMAANQAFLEGKIRFEGVGAYNTVKWILIESMTDITRRVASETNVVGILLSQPTK